MKIVIDIPRKTYEHIRSWGGHGIFNIQGDDNLIVTKAIFDGLPYKEKPHGKWIEHDSKELSDKGFYLCSRCKAGFQRYERGVRHSDLPWIDGQKYELHRIDSFCPNCGADMRGGKV